MCIILSVDHLSCSHTVAVWHHCQKAPKTRLFGPAPCGRIRQHARPILTRKLCHNCGGPRILNFRKPSEVVQIKEEKGDSRYSARDSSEEKSRSSLGSLEEEMEHQALSKGKARETIYEESENDKENDDLLLLRKRDAGYRPHHYKNGHWTPRRGSEYSTSRRGSEYSASIRSKRVSQLSRSIYSDTGSEISEFEDAIGKARGSDWPKSPKETTLFPGPPLPMARTGTTTSESNVRNNDNAAASAVHHSSISISPPSSSTNSSPSSSPQNEHPYWDTGPVKPDPASPASTNIDSITHYSEDSDSSTRSSRSSENFILPGVDDASPHHALSHNNNNIIHFSLPTRKPSQSHGHAKKDSGVDTDTAEDEDFKDDTDEPSPDEIEQYSVIMATTATMARASRISFHGGMPLRAGKGTIRAGTGTGVTSGGGAVAAGD